MGQLPQSAPQQRDETPPDRARVAATERTEAEPTIGDSFLFLTQRVFLYFVLYALSIGPFYWQWYRSQFVGGSSVPAAFYLPLVKFAEWVPPFGEWMDWYVGLWIS